MTTIDAHRAITRFTDEEITGRVLHRDGLILVVNKPAGLAVHNAGPCLHNLEQYFHLLTFGLPNPPLLAHRLDRGTSGCLVLARHAKAARMMQVLFTEAKVRKTYHAWVHGVVAEDSGRIDIPLKKISSASSNWRMKTDPTHGKIAVTEFSVLHRCETSTLLKLSPLTGRTHQLRVHCTWLGHPIIGDGVYGQDMAPEPNLLLHAFQIEIPLNPKKPALMVTAPWPEHMQRNGLAAPVLTGP